MKKTTPTTRVRIPRLTASPVGCSHIAARDVREEAFIGGVSVSPYTEENQAAHGWITATVECTVCGATRQENRNGSHREYGTWHGGSPDDE